MVKCLSECQQLWYRFFLFAFLSEYQDLWDLRPEKWSECECVAQAFDCQQWHYHRAAHMDAYENPDFYNKATMTPNWGVTTFFRPVSTLVSRLIWMVSEVRKYTCYLKLSHSFCAAGSSYLPVLPSWYRQQRPKQVRVRLPRHVPDVLWYHTNGAHWYLQKVKLQ